MAAREHGVGGVGGGGGSCDPFRRSCDGSRRARVLAGSSRPVPAEEFAERLEHPYPVPLALLSPREEAPALPADSNLRLRLCAAGMELQPWAVCKRVPPEEECLADPICEIHWEGESRSPLMDEEVVLQ